MVDITVQELKAKLDNKEEFLFIDVREPHEFEEFNIGARLIPLGTLPDALEELEAYKNKEIVVHCRSGARSGRAKEFLVANGFTNVSNLLGGALAWAEAYNN
jgi:rhodanese-related sulfurtransferase